MSVTDYASIRTELNNYTLRSYTTAQVDTFLGQSESEFNIYLGPNHVRETSATVNTDASGVAALPAGFVRFLSLSHATYGNVELTTWDALTAFNPTGAAGIPTKCAIQGTSLKVAHVLDGDFTLNYEATLAPLTSLVTSNWLLAKAPHVYFQMVMAQSKLFEEDAQQAAIWKAMALKSLRDLGIQSMVAQYGRAGMKVRGATP